jgi:hypothetical protein
MATGEDQCSAPACGTIVVHHPSSRRRHRRRVGVPRCAARGNTARNGLTTEEDPSCHCTWGIASCEWWERPPRRRHHLANDDRLLADGHHRHRHLGSAQPEAGHCAGVVATLFAPEWLP